MSCRCVLDGVGQTPLDQIDLLASSLDHAFFYRTSGGAEIDLLLELPGSKL